MRNNLLKQKKGKDILGKQENRKDILLIILLLIAHLGCGRSVANNPDTSAENAKRLPVETQRLVKQDYSSTLNFSGIIKPFKRVDIGFKIAGRIETLYFDEGDDVLKGDVLATLEKDEHQAAIRQAEAAYHQAKNHYERNKRLIQDGTISPAEIEDTESAYKISKAALDLARIQSKNTTLLAPLSGKLVFRDIEEKETVTPGKPYFTLMDIRNVILEIGVPEYQIARLFPGQKAIAVVDSYPEKRFSGEINKVALAINDDNKLFKVEIKLDNTNELLKPGMIASIEIEVERFKDVYVLPLEAVLESNGERYIYMERDGIAVKKVIQNYHPHKAHVILNDHIHEGDRLVVKGHHLLSDGVRIYTK